MTIRETLLHCIHSSKLSQRAIAKGSGVLEQVISKFVHGDTGLALVNADKLCRFFGLVLIQRYQRGPLNTRPRGRPRKEV